jgi:hypothetical protein
MPGALLKYSSDPLHPEKSPSQGVISGYLRRKQPYRQKKKDGRARENLPAAEQLVGTKTGRSKASRFLNCDEKSSDELFPDTLTKQKSLPPFLPLNEGPLDGNSDYRIDPTFF